MNGSFYILWFLVAGVLLVLFVLAFIKAVKIMNEKVKNKTLKRIIIRFTTLFLGLYIALRLVSYIVFEYSGDSPNRTSVMMEIKEQLEKKYGKRLDDLTINFVDEVVIRESPKSGYLIIEFTSKEENGKKRVDYDDYKNNKKLLFRDVE